MEIIKNGKAFTKNFTFEKADIILDKGEIKDREFYIKKHLQNLLGLL